MPHRNVLREFLPDRSYHVYNRGVEKRLIFEDEQDYGVFLNRLKLMLSDPDELERREDMPKQPIKSFYGQIELLAYCLMPNHFHLLIHQYDETALSEFMRTLSTSYTMYFNSRYDRVGSLFQGRYKGRLIDNDAYRLHISRYIHLNPLVLGEDIENYPYSSLYYFRTRALRWLSPGKVLEDHSSYQDYLNFVNDYINPDKHRSLREDCSLE